MVVRSWRLHYPLVDSFEVLVVDFGAGGGFLFARSLPHKEGSSYAKRPRTSFQNTSEDVDAVK